MKTGSMCMLGLLVAAGAAAAANGQISMREIARIDVSGQFTGGTPNGANPSAVAWNGQDLFVAGFASAGGANTEDAGIVKYNASGVVQAQFGARPGTPFNRGYSGLDIRNGTLAAAYDVGENSNVGITAWDLSGNLLWSKNARGGSGVAFDPGFNGVDSGVAYTAFGSGRRALQDATTGADIYTLSDGMIITPDFGSSFWRSMDFDASGNMVARRANDVTFLTRTGGNSGSASILVDNNAEAQFVNGQNVAFVYDSVFGDFIIYNDRASSAVGQAASDVIRVVDLGGNMLTLDLSLIGGGSLLDGNAYYDFSWDAASGTLAVLDFANRNVHIFNVPAPGAVALLGLAGLASARRRRG